MLTGCCAFTLYMFGPPPSLALVSCSLSPLTLIRFALQPPDSMPSLGVSSIGVSSVSLLNAVASHCQLPLVSYLWEMGSDGVLLAGVELVLVSGEHLGQRGCRFFWCVAFEPYETAHEPAAREAVRFLQSIYGFVVHDYNFRYMVSYREIAASAIDLAIVALTCLAHMRAPHDLHCFRFESLFREFCSVWFAFVAEEHNLNHFGWM